MATQGRKRELVREEERVNGLVGGRQRERDTESEVEETRGRTTKGRARAREREREREGGNERVWSVLR